MKHQSGNKMVLSRIKNGGDTILQKTIRTAFLFSKKKKKKANHEYLTNQKLKCVCVGGRESLIRVRGVTPRHIKTMYACTTERQEILQKLLYFYLIKSNKKNYNNYLFLLFLKYALSQKTS